MRYEAAILVAPKRPLVLTEVELTALGPEQVIVRVEASGICHTDYEVYAGAIDLPMPLILGHEVAGEVVELGAAVSDVRVGDRVVCSWNPACGRCFYCVRGQPILCEVTAVAASTGRLPGDSSPRLSADGAAVHQFSLIGGHADYVVVDQRTAIPVRSDMPTHLACLLGCTASTGVCGAIRAAAVRPGSAVAVVGCGAIGLCAVQGALIAGARTVIAIDTNPERLAAARALGATLTLHPGLDPVGEAIREGTGGRGADYVIEAAGSVAAFQAALDACRPGGRVVFLGKVPVDREVPLRFGSFQGEKEIVRSSYGGTRPARDFAILADFWASGDLNLEALVSRRFAPADINDGLAAVAGGQTLHSVVDHVRA